MLCRDYTVIKPECLQSVLVLVVKYCYETSLWVFNQCSCWQVNIVMTSVVRHKWNKTLLLECFKCLLPILPARHPAYTRIKKSI